MSTLAYLLGRALGAVLDAIGGRQDIPVEYIPVTWRQSAACEEPYEGSL